MHVDGRGNSQSDALGENPTKAGDASPQMPEPVEIVESESDDLPNEAPSYSQGVMHSELVVSGARQSNYKQFAFSVCK